MGWIDLKPVARHAANRPVPVALKISPPRSGSPTPRLAIAIRVSDIEGGLAWLKAGSAVRVLEGNGDNAGQIMIKASGPFRVAQLGPSGRGGALTVFAPVPACVRAELKETPRMPAEFDWDADWIGITLPAAWLRAPVPPEEKAPFKTVATVAKPPASMVGGR